MPTAADDTMEVPTLVIQSNLATRNLFCYFFLRSNHILTMQTTKNQNMAGTKVQTSKVWKCPIFPDLARFSGETGSKALPFFSGFFLLFIKPENPHFASHLEKKVKPLGVYPPGPPSYPWRSYQSYNTTWRHSTYQLRLTRYKLSSWLASLDLRKPCTSHIRGFSSSSCSF